MPRYGVPQLRKGREIGTPRQGLIQGLVPCSSFSMMVAVIRAAGDWAGEREAGERLCAFGDRVHLEGEGG